MKACLFVSLFPSGPGECPSPLRRRVLTRLATDAAAEAVRRVLEEHGETMDPVQSKVAEVGPGRQLSLEQLERILTEEINRVAAEAVFNATDDDGLVC